MFCDGSHVYKRYNKDYKKHKKGYIILGPPGIGKTTFVKNQKGKKDWIDADDLFKDLGVKWHQNEKNDVDFRLNYLRADYMLEQSKLLGYRVIGSLFYKYKPDAIVIPRLNIHKKYIAKRKDLKLQNVIDIRKYLLKRAKKYNVPVFDNIEEAVYSLNNI
jgi:hypothetical protein